MPSGSVQPGNLPIRDSFTEASDTRTTGQKAGVLAKKAARGRWRISQSG
jgi:hypothetical protein